LASFSRLILFDKRGTGLSDRPPTVDLDHWVEDTRAVLDAVGSERAVVLGISAGAPTALLFAACNPDRTRGLVLFGGFARGLRAVDFPFGWDTETLEDTIEHLRSRWGTGVMLKVYAPSAGRDPRARAYFARLQRISASPTAAVTFLRALQAPAGEVLVSRTVKDLVVGSGIEFEDRGRRSLDDVAVAGDWELYAVTATT